MDRSGFKQTLDEFLKAGDPSDPKVRKRQKILNAAYELFREHGYRKSSVDEVAERAGVAKGTVYLYYKNKTDLLMHAIAEEKRRYQERLRPVLDQSMPPTDRLKLWIRTALVLGREMPLISKMISGDREILLALEDIEETDAYTAGLIQAFRYEFLGEMLDEAAAPHRWTSLELSDRVKVLVGLVYFSSLLADDRVRSGLAPERFAEILSDMIVDGVSTKTDSGSSKKQEGGER